MMRTCKNWNVSYCASEFLKCNDKGDNQASCLLIRGTLLIALIADF